MKEFETLIFDIDGTLTPEISWPAITKSLGASVEQHLEIYQDLREGKITYEESKQRLLSLWKATGNANRQFFVQLFESWPLREEAIVIIDSLKSRGLTICLITGSVDLYAEIIAGRLGVNHYFANTELVWDENGNLIDLHYHQNQGEKKLEQFLEFCRKQNINPQDCVIIGDDENDIELFVFTGKGVAVKSETSHKLEGVAWKKIDNVLHLQEII